MTGLHVADDVVLPLDIITSSNGILAKKGAGKTSAAVVLLEEMLLRLTKSQWGTVIARVEIWLIRPSVGIVIMIGMSVRELSKHQLLSVGRCGRRGKAMNASMIRRFAADCACMH